MTEPSARPVGTRTRQGSTRSATTTGSGGPSTSTRTGGRESTRRGAPVHVPTVQRAPERVRRDVERAGKAGVAGYHGGGTLFTEPVLVVNQKAKLIEINNEYAIYDQHARQIAAVREVGQSTLKKAARLLTSLDQYMTHALQIVDMQGTPLLALTRRRSW